ncbi:MAG: hypothetical protein EAZ76_16320 [Nostocales cyanobacterium]|nr:MAG: hypothetical protein EAZ87_23815 [Nostocales cyanobacterium]TAF09332.1 MAG: hypothetical protein EAZ76_16320 [Nostocales cyanobacterium]
MSYVSMLKNIPELLNQPTGIAALASVGIHGAIALIVPLMPVDSTPSTAANSKKAVGLIELSPEEQARLPQTSENAQTALQPLQLPQQPQIKLPSFDTQVAVIPPLETPLPSQGGLPVIPKSTSNYNLSYLPKQQAAPMFTQRDFRTQVSNFRISNLPRSVPRVAPRSVSPFVDDIDTQIRETQPLNVSRLPQVQPNDDISGEPLVNPSADAIDIGSTKTPGEYTEFTHPNIANKNTEVNEGGSAGLLVGESLERRSKLVSVAPTESSSSENSSQGQVVVPTMSRAEAQIQKNQQLLARLNSGEDSRQVVEIKPQTVIRKTIATDNPEMEGTVSGELVVDANGKVLDIKFQGGKVSPQLQSKTRAFLSANVPKGEKQVSSYPFQLQFKNVDNGSMSGKNVQVKPAQNQNSQPVADQQESKNQPKNQAVVIPNPSPTAGVVEEKSGAVDNSSSTLIQKLRQVKEDRQTSKSDQ